VLKLGVSCEKTLRVKARIGESKTQLGAKNRKESSDANPD
jgi:hypothetical protein